MNPDFSYGRYQLLLRSDGTPWELLRDASAVTFKATDTGLGVPVVLSVVHARHVSDGASRTIIMQRILDIARVAGDEVESVLAVEGDERRLFYVRQFVPGRSVQQLVDEKGTLPWRDALLIVRRVAQALKSAHAVGITHRHLTPSHIILRGFNDGTPIPPVTLVNLAVTPENHASAFEEFAQSTAGSSVSASATGLAFPFASPEWLRNMPQDTRSDIYSLGVVLWFMVTGSPLMAEQGAGQLPKRLQMSRKLQLPPGIPELVSTLLRHMMAPSFHDRLGAQELLNEIDRLLEPPVGVKEGTNDFSAMFGPPEFTHDSVRPVPSTMSAASPEQLITSTESLQFTAYRPRIVRPHAWTRMLVFAHLEDKPAWMDETERAPFEEVEAQARQLLGSRVGEYRHTTDDSRSSVPRDGEITIVPEMSGVEFNPPSRSFFWRDGIAVHAEMFDFRAAITLDGATARGRLTIFLGRIILAEISLAIRVDSRYLASFPVPLPVQSEQNPEHERSSSRAFRRVFASYSHRDLDVVEEVERHTRSLGDQYLRDWVHLRSGERWNDGLRQLITEADVFQLFWSTNSARSNYVAEEWQYALQLARDTFVRPTYWEVPMPKPPEPLRSLHFHRLALSKPPVYLPTPADHTSLIRPITPSAASVRIPSSTGWAPTTPLTVKPSANADEDAPSLFDPARRVSTPGQINKPIFLVAIALAIVILAALLVWRTQST